ncbi:hypothetical protein [Heyndrickxia vini]|uniref:Uncharacterized protein n=1 Tax=Heyndrickxia vini TaxID=1476025 RepID=A0ABX7E3Z3_9BACI|nr:hypothetical protein [Heyndrickxia vini]QQZ09082.1 hypothetical protein I5776_19195 [Heyndrickxia vini]
MNHVSDEEWILYVNDLLDEEIREQYDTHLFVCDQCLSVYLEVIEAQEGNLPPMKNGGTFADSVMMTIEQQQASVKKDTVSKIYQKPVFHYVLATAMTFVFMTTGVFTHLMNVVNVFETNNKQAPSVVEELMKNTVSFIDKVQIQKKSWQEDKK